MTYKTIFQTTFLATLLCLAACSDDTDAFNPSGGNNYQTAGLGDACKETKNCESGLKCEESVCVFAADIEEGSPCRRTGECAPSLFCDALTSSCATAGTTEEGRICNTTADCEAGLTCQPQGLSAVCAQSGEGDLGAECTTTANCLAGLNCAKTTAQNGPTCTAGPQGSFVPWVGTACERSKNEEGPSRFFFEVPGKTVDEFYRLPYPNDIRLKNGRPDLSGHPTPGPGILGFDIVQTYIDAIEKEQDRFGLNRAIIFRYTEDVNLEDLKKSGAMRLVNVDPTSSTYGESHPISWSAVSGNTSNGAYICQNWLAIRPLWGRPLAPDSTYALIITKAVGNTAGQALEPDADLAAMLMDARPTGDDDVSAAWDSYSPLRLWAAQDESIVTSNIAAATVFSTGNPFTVSQKLAQAVAPSPLQTEAWVKCADDVSSPCDDGTEASTRKCGASDVAFSELHTKISLPILQQGTPPYLAQGGQIELDGNAPKIQRQEKVCMAMTVPTTTMPEAGWPVVIYAHGTGGAFNSHVGQISNQFSTLKSVDGEAGVIVVGWDQVQHFGRKGESKMDAEPLVFNYGNPQAAKGNFLQAAADIHAISNFVKKFELAAANSPTGEIIKIDPTKIFFMGHSQGGTSGPLALPFNEDIKGAILSGAGGGLSLALLNKTKPVNAKDGLMIAFQDKAVGASHPVLNLIQGYFEPVDPINYAAYIGARQIEGVTTPKHMLHIFGAGDNYTPPAGQKAFALASRAWYMEPIFDEFKSGGIRLVKEDIKANLTVSEQKYTVAGRQYEPGEYDGHFVAFRNDLAKDNINAFVRTMVLSTEPTLFANTSPNQ